MAILYDIMLITRRCLGGVHALRAQIFLFFNRHWRYTYLLLIFILIPRDGHKSVIAALCIYRIQQILHIHKISENFKSIIITISKLSEVLVLWKLLFLVVYTSTGANKPLSV